MWSVRRDLWSRREGRFFRRKVPGRDYYNLLLTSVHNFKSFARTLNDPPLSGLYLVPMFSHLQIWCRCSNYQGHPPLFLCPLQNSTIAPAFLHSFRPCSCTFYEHVKWDRRKRFTGLIFSCPVVGNTKWALIGSKSWYRMSGNQNMSYHKMWIKD